MMKEKGYADWIASFSQDYDGGGIWNGAYIVEILLDMPAMPPPPRKKFWGPIKENNEEDDNYAMIAAKVKKFIDSKDFEFYKQGFDLVDVYDMSDLITQEEANELKEKILDAALGLPSPREIIDEIKEMLDEIKGLSEEKRLDLEWEIYHYLSMGSLEEAVEYALRKLDVKVIAIDPVTLLALEGEPKELEKAKARLRRFGQEEELFAPAPKPGLLLFGSLAERYVDFHKKMEEIFGATPGGAIQVGGGDLALYLRVDYPGTVKAPIANNHDVTVSITFEWSVELGFGMEFTLVPAKLATQPSQLLNDYYGIWVDQWKEGPNIGKLEIGIQSEEDDFEDNKSVQNDNGTYGFTKEEMKKKILELTGIDLDEIN
jgi:hypothetical protein